MGVNDFLSKLLTFLGLVVLLHAAYSANHYKTISLVSGLETSSSPPFDIIVECFGALSLLIVGQIFPIKFEPVIMTADRASKAQEESLGRPELNTFNHRSRELHIRAQRHSQST